MSDSSVNSDRPRRRKASGPRSKVGCVTCRIRRVKCDEGKPDCNKCSSTGRRCDWERAAPNPHTDVRSFDPQQPPPMSLVPMASRDYQERRSFAFFHTQTAPQLSGSFGSSFWDFMILQSTHQNPILWHAAVALGSMHEAFSFADPSTSPSLASLNGADEDFALKQYSKAIRGLATPVGNGAQHADVVLAACMLFACFEIMRGHHGAALGHAISGVKILAEVQNRHDSATGNQLIVAPNPLISIETLTILFTRLDTQVCELLPHRLDRILKSSHKYEAGFGPTIPARFSSVLEARNSFDYVYNNAIHMAEIKRGPSTLFSQGQDTHTFEILGSFAIWENAFLAFLHDYKTRLDGKAQQAVNMLKLQLITLKQTFSTIEIPGEMIWDSFGPDYEDIIELAEAILRQDIENGAAGPRCVGSLPSCTLFTDTVEDEVFYHTDGVSPLGSSASYGSLPMRTFSLDAGIITPLYNTIWKCRVSRIRRKGIELLRSYPRQEGVWDGVLVAIACERIVAIEEEGSDGWIEDPADLPEWKRILEIAVTFDQENRRASLEYSRMKSRDDNEIVKIIDYLAW